VLCDRLQDQTLGLLAPPIKLNWIFFFWDYVKDQIFRPKVDSVVELRAGINNATASATPQTKENPWREMEYRLNILRATNDAHIEMY
jgi:hypothetical protein